MTEALAGLPRITLKLATSLDGRIATRSGQSKWITGALARRHVHQMRAEHDCVLTGSGTVLADDPELTVRLDAPVPRQPLRAVLDTQARIQSDAKLLKTLNLGPVCLFHQLDMGLANTVDGVRRFYVGPGRDGIGLDLRHVLSVLQDQCDVKSVMIEAGARLAGAFLRARLVTKLVWFRAPIVIGGDGLSVFTALGVNDLSDALAFDIVDLTRVGDDAMETYRVRETV